MGHHAAPREVHQIDRLRSAIRFRRLPAPLAFDLGAQHQNVAESLQIECAILGQAAVPVDSSDTPDTLAARILEAEHRLYPRVLAAYAAGQILIVDERVSWAGSVNQGGTLFSPNLG